MDSFGDRVLAKLPPRRRHPLRRAAVILFFTAAAGCAGALVLRSLAGDVQWQVGSALIALVAAVHLTRDAESSAPPRASERR